jgi:hypothetical protein
VTVNRLPILPRTAAALAVVVTVAACGGSSSPETPRPAPAPQPADVQVGDPTVSYMNPEFTPDGRFMVWFEPLPDGLTADGRLFGRMWHCAVDAETGTFDPPDCKGFSGVPTTIWARANTGLDAQGPYYVGQFAVQGSHPDNDRLVVVRPTGARSGVVEVLGASMPQPRRRSIFPTAVAERPAAEQFVWWLENDVGFSPSQASSVSLKFIARSAPAAERTVTTQAARGAAWAPMDVTYVRLLPGTTRLTFGAPAAAGTVEIATVDLADPSLTVTFVTADGRPKLDPYPFRYAGSHYIVAGIDGTDQSIVYRSTSATSPFVAAETIAVPAPPASQIAAGKACQPQSHEPFAFAGALYTAYQVGDCSDPRQSFVTRPGEIWLSTIGATPQRQWRLSRDGAEAKNEPEPLVGRTRAWVFYTAYPAGASPLTVRHTLRRVALPLAQ